MCRAFLGLGSNLGNRSAYLSKALDEIKEIVPIERVSSVYETEPWRMTTALPFYNMAVEITTVLMPRELLNELKRIEKKLGRSQDTHMKSREIDIDILLYEGFTVHVNDVVVPHPELSQRRFALQPLCDIASAIQHPVFKKSIEQLLRECPDASRVVKTSERMNELSTQAVRA